MQQIFQVKIVRLRPLMLVKIQEQMLQEPPEKVEIVYEALVRWPSPEPEAR